MIKFHVREGRAPRERAHSKIAEIARKVDLLERRTVRERARADTFDLLREEEESKGDALLERARADAFETLVRRNGRQFETLVKRFVPDMDKIAREHDPRKLHAPVEDAVGKFGERLGKFNHGELATSREGPPTDRRHA